MKVLRESSGCLITAMTMSRLAKDINIYGNRNAGPGMTILKREALVTIQEIRMDVCCPMNVRRVVEYPPECLLNMQ